MSISGMSLCRTRARAIIEHAVDAVHQPFEGGPVEQIGAAETMHHARLSPLYVRVPDALCEGVIDDRRAVCRWVMRRYMSRR